MPTKNAHCSYCGAPFADQQKWPRHCATCNQTSFINPIPVAVMVLPVEQGLLAIRRGIPPHVGELALPGGFIDHGEDWRTAAARELFEETGIEINPDHVREHRVLSAPDGTLLVFGLGPAQRIEDLPTFLPTNETTERTVIDGALELAFPLHTQVVAEYFAQRGR